MNHQDFTPIVLNKKYKSTQTGKKKTNPNPKVAEDGEIPQIKCVPRDLAQQIQTARINKGWTQKEVALKINEKTSVVADIEVGKAIYDPKIISKLRRLLQF